MSQCCTSLSGAKFKNHEGRLAGLKLKFYSKAKGVKGILRDTPLSTVGNSLFL